MLKNFLIIIFAITLLASCTQKPADVIYNTNNFYGKNQQKKSSTQKLGATKAIIATKSKTITVGKDETLYSIARKNQVSLRDLIKTNNLSAPYNIKAGDRLKLPQNNYHIVQKGETIYSISRLYEMNINNLISLNDLSAPFQLKIGQRLIVAKTEIQETKPQIAQKKTPNKNKILSKDKGILRERKLDNNLSSFSWPIQNPKIISTFGPKGSGLYNDGVNIAAKEGDAVKSAEDGVVAYVGNELKAYGNLIIVKHDNGWITAYGHLSKTDVEVGNRIKKSQIIGKVGSTGNVDKSQLYFGLRKGRDAVDPESYLR